MRMSQTADAASQASFSPTTDPPSKAHPTLAASAAHGLGTPTGSNAQAGGTSRDLLLKDSAGEGSLMMVNSSDLASKGSADNLSTTRYYLDAAKRYPTASEAELWAEAIRRDPNRGGTVLTAAARNTESPAREGKGAPGMSLGLLPYSDGVPPIDNTFVQRPAKAQSRKSKRALTVGNSDYSDTSALGDLPGAGRDASAMASRYEGMGFEVREEADLEGEELKKAMNDVSADLQPGDEVIFYYSGHAYKTDLYGVDTRNDSRTGKKYGIAPTGPLNAAAATAIGKGAHLQVVIDACNSSPMADAAATSLKDNTNSDISSELQLDPEQEVRSGLKYGGGDPVTPAMMREKYQSNL